MTTPTPCAPLIEGCVDSYASALAACRGGADRLELCGQLVIGGVTPSPAMLEQVLRDCPVPVNVLIRPRFATFCIPMPRWTRCAGRSTCSAAWASTAWSPEP